MSSNGVDSHLPGRRQSQSPRWSSRLLIILIALILSTIIVLFFFTSGAR